MKLKKKLLLSFTAITIIPLMCMTIFAYTQYVHIINRHITTIADNEFKNLSLKVRESYAVSYTHLTLPTTPYV